MQTSSKIFRLEGVVQHYSWGGHNFIPSLIGLVNSDKNPCAEWWLGAHQNAPSLVHVPGKMPVRLDEFIREDVEGVLGTTVAKNFGKLPYLFKVLDVKDMLSIQVHPSKKSAERGFAAETMRGIPLTAPTRNYKDDNHKPELMYALSEFWLLHGFKNPSTLEEALEAIPELNFLLPIWKAGRYEAIYKTVMEMPAGEVTRHLEPLINRILPLYEMGQLDKDGPDFWAARAFKTFCEPGKIDRGIFSIYFFNVVHLHPGQAIFQDAGILHAYLEGQNLEIMANSDNVLRGGLTNKQVDVPELLKHVRFLPIEPAIIKEGSIVSKGIEQFLTPAKDFQLQKLTIGAGDSLMIQAFTADIYLVLSGIVEVFSENQGQALHKGEAFLTIAGCSLRMESVEGATLFRATVPYSQ